MSTYNKKFYIVFVLVLSNLLSFALGCAALYMYLDSHNWLWILRFFNKSLL